MNNKFLVFLFLLSGVLSAQDFIIKKSNPVTSMSKNRLKEEIGNITRQAFNSTTRLEKIIGNFKINLSQEKFDFYQVENGSLAAQVGKSDGLLHVELAEIQSCFSEVISNLVENERFFKKASRGDLRELLTLMQKLSNDLNKQVAEFDSLGNTVADASKSDSLYGKIKHQFVSCADELKSIQEKIQGSKCLKKKA
jgi:hypothetical protein